MIPKVPCEGKVRTLQKRGQLVNPLVPELVCARSRLIERAFHVVLSSRGFESLSARSYKPVILVW